MTEAYRLIEVFTSEDVRWQGHPASKAVIDFVAGLGQAARSIVTRGIGGSYENGDKTTLELEVLSYHLPLKIEILVPAAAFEAALAGVVERVPDGMVCVSDRAVVSRRSTRGA